MEFQDKGWEKPQETPPNYPFWTRMRKALVIVPVMALTVIVYVNATANVTGSATVQAKATVMAVTVKV